MSATATLHHIHAPLHTAPTAHLLPPLLSRPSVLCLSLSLTAAVGGYIVIVTQLHPETNDDDVTDAFSDFGPITTLHLNLDRRTGYVKGYALIEYGREEEARRAVEEGDGMVVMERQVKVDWAFRRGSEGAASSGRERRRGPAGDGSSGGGGGGGRSRGVIRRDYRDLSGRDRDRDRDRGRDRGGDSGRERDRDR